MVPHSNYGSSRAKGVCDVDKVDSATAWDKWLVSEGGWEFYVAVSIVTPIRYNYAPHQQCWTNDSMVVLCGRPSEAARHLLVTLVCSDH